MKRSKKLVVMLVILAVACAATFAMTRYEERQEQIRNSGEVILALNEADVQAVSWIQGETGLAFHRDETGVWRWDEDDAFPVDEEVMGQLLAIFESFPAAFVIEDVEDYAQYGLDAPEGTVTLSTADASYPLEMGAFSALDSQRYLSLGDGNVYLVDTDPLDTYDVQLSDLILHDELPVFGTVDAITFTGAEGYTLIYQEDRSASYCTEDVYFADGNPLDTEKVSDYLENLSYLELYDYVSYNATDEELNTYGLSEPALSVQVDYTEHNEDETTTANSFTIHIGVVTEEAEDEEPATTAYARVGDSQIFYRLAKDDELAVLAYAYDDLRHEDMFTADFETVTAIDITLEGATYNLVKSTVADEDSEEETVWKYGETEVDIAGIQSKLNSLTADSFTDAEAAGKEEVRVVVHMENDHADSIEIVLYRQDGEYCLCEVNGVSTALIPRGNAVDLIEAANTSLMRLSTSVSSDITSFYVSGETTMEEAEVAITELLMERFGEDEDAFTVSSTDIMEDAMSSVTSILTILLGGIAAISLIVGGIGIMNIMLVTVTERTREIGIRKAIGATRGEILRQFLIEAIVLCMMGCAIGIALSWAVLQVVSTVVSSLSMTFQLEPNVVTISVVFCFFIGLVFGLYPANKAAKMQPILAGIALAIYAFLLLGRLGRYYADRSFWQFGRKYTLGLRLLLAIAAGIVCFNIWSAAAMVALHLASFFILTDAMNLLIRRLSRKSSPKWQRLYGSGVPPMVLLACVMLYGSINMNRVVQTDYIITTQKAIRAEGYRVAFLSDIHYGTVQDKAVLQASIREINAQEPDIVVLGGDIVEEGTALEEMQEVFYRLDAPLGIYFVYGNHDRQADSKSRTYTDEELIAAIEGNGITILEDETQLVGGDLLLIGRADAAWDQQTIRKEISELILPGQEDLFLLTLDHQPLEAEENAAAGVDLMLSGHTHAGQLFPVGYLTEWTGGMNYGLYQTGSCQSIVSSGFAGWGYGIRTQGYCEYLMVEIDQK